jgi:endonuclease/exonuclease/phosphatase family metal-dependent hydrolase
VAGGRPSGQSVAGTRTRKSNPDLNAEPGAPELRPLCSRLVDAWPAGGVGSGFTISSTAAARRIDYVFVTRGTGVDGAYVPQTIGSDHLPVVADMTLPRRGGDDDD